MDRSARIARNTILLYVRMFFTMGVGIYTSRVVLNVLGIEDYGIYNVVGGVVALFSFLSGALSTAISRYLTYSLGKEDKNRLCAVFSTSLNIQFLLGIIIVGLAEILGVWFLNSKLNIPDGRMDAANWVIQFTILMFFIDIVKAPYNAAIIAHENMDAFAYISIVEVILKLVIVYSLQISPYDKLKTYAVLLAVVSVVIWLAYYLYCKIKYEECTYHRVMDKPLAKEMIGFASWNLVGNGVYILNTQGVNIVTNIYFGVAVNAARGIVNQIHGLMMQFVNNFTTAINPQITKSYAIGDYEYLFKLICKGAKYSYYLMLFFLVPFMFEIELVLEIWLKEYPPYTPLFLRLMIIGQMVDFLGNTTARTVWATGNVRKYYIWTGFVGSLVFPLSYLLFYLGFSAEWSYWVFILIYAILIPIRLHIVKELVGFQPKRFYIDVILNVLVTTVVSFIIPGILYYTLDSNWYNQLLIIIVSLLSVFLSISFVGIDSSERRAIISKIPVINRIIHINK